MGKSGDGFGSNENDDNMEESSDEGENNQSSSSVGSSSSDQGAIYNVPQGGQWLGRFLHWLFLNITYGWQWLISLLIGIGISIFGTCNRNRHAKNGHFPASDMFIIMFTLFATILIITHIPLDIENRQTDIIAIPVIDENVQHDNFDDGAIDLFPYDDGAIDLFPYDEPGSQFVIRGSNASEAVDNRTYDLNSFISAKMLDNTDSTHTIGDENGINLSSVVEPYVGDVVELDSDSDDGENVTSEISLDLNDFEDDQINDSDEEDRWSDISHITYYISNEEDSINENETDSLVDNEKDALGEIQNNAPTDEEISTIEPSMLPILLTDATIENDADLLSNFEPLALMSSMNPSDTEQSSSFILTVKESSSQIFENHARNMDPLILTDIQIPADSNANHHEESDQAVGSEIGNNNPRQDHVLISSDTSLGYGQNNEQAASRTLLSDQSFDQALPIEKTRTGESESESDGEEMVHTTRSRSMELPKRTSPAVDSDEASAKQNVE